MPPVRPTPPLTIDSALRRAWNELIDEVVEGFSVAGYGDLRPAHAPVLGELLASNLRPSELGFRLGISKQAANDLVREFEAKRFITLEPDPADGRAKRIIATDRGWQASETARRRAESVRRRWARLVGDERYAVFEDVLREIVAANDSHAKPSHRPSSRT